MENFWYLFTAFAIVWAVLFGYVFSLLRRQRQLWRELDSLKETLRERGKTSERNDC